jgi:hypothetical protein
VLHDEQMDEEQRKGYHAAYARLADAVDAPLRTLFCLIGEADKAYHATGTTDHATPLMMMFAFGEAIDGVSVMVRAGSARNCPQLLRTGFEIALSLQYVLQEPTTCKQRSLAHEFYHLQGELKWAQKCDPLHELGKQIRAELKGDALADLFDVGKRGIDVKKEQAIWEGKLNSPRYADVRAEIDRIKAAKKKAQSENKPFGESSANWYSLWNGPKDVRGLAARLNHLAMYEILYRTWSAVTHGEASLKRISGRADGGMLLDAIRTPAGLPEMAQHACNLTMIVANVVVDKVVPEQREWLQQHYLTTLRDALARIKSVSIDD